MRTRPNAGPSPSKRQKAKDGVGQVRAVESSRKRVHSVVGNNAVTASLLGLLCMTITIRKQWRVPSQQRHAHLSAEAWRTFGSNCSSKSVQRSPVSPFSLASETVSTLGCHLFRHVLDGWTSVRDPLLQLAREVLTVHSSPASGRILIDSLPISHRPGVNVKCQWNATAKAITLVWDLTFLSSMTGCSQCDALHVLAVRLAV